MSDVKYKKTDNGGRFSIFENDLEAYMTYINAGETKIIIDHTIVPEELGGKGLGKKLLAAAVEFMRENNLKTVPTCPFAIAQIVKNPDYHDIAEPALLNR